MRLWFPRWHRIAWSSMYSAHCYRGRQCTCIHAALLANVVYLSKLYAPIISHTQHMYTPTLLCTAKTHTHTHTHTYTKFLKRTVEIRSGGCLVGRIVVSEGCHRDNRLRPQGTTTTGTEHTLTSPAHGSMMREDGGE